MSIVRRRVLRPARAEPSAHRRQRQIDRRRDRLEKERVALARWLSRLRRAFHALEKSQRRIASLERQLRQIASEQAGS